MGTHSKYLVIGGAGFIGSNVAANYLAAGADVTIFDNFDREGSRHNVAWLEKEYGNRLTVIEADIRYDYETLEREAQKADVVFHLAAQVAVTTSVTNPREDFEINALGTFNVLEAIRNSTSRPILLYTSTNKVYGKMEDLDTVESNGRYAYANAPQGISESRPLDFHSPYGCSKGCGDQYVIDYARIYGLKTVVFRQSCIYGPRQFGMEDQGWVAWFAIRAMQGRPVTIYGDGKQVRDVLHVADLLRAYDLAITHIDRCSGKAYNIGGGPNNTMSLLELVDLLKRRFPRGLECTFDNWRPGDQLVYVSNIDAAKRDFGWEPAISPAAGVDRLVEWLVANRQLFEASEPVLVPPVSVRAARAGAAA